MVYHSRELSTHLNSFNERLINFIRRTTPSLHQIILPWEGYSLVTVAGHIGGPRHYGIIEFAEKILGGEALPEVNTSIIARKDHQDLEERQDWSSSQVIDYLIENVIETETFISSLSENDLNTKGRINSVGGEFTIKQLIEWVIIDSSVEHFENMRRIIA